MEREKEPRQHRQEARNEHLQPHRHKGVNIHIHPLASLLVITLLSFIAFVVFIVYAIANRSDFIASTLSLMHDGWWLMRVVGILLVAWLGVHVVGHMITKVLLPLIEGFHRLVIAFGQFKKNRVLAEQHGFVYVDNDQGGAFHHISQVRERSQDAIEGGASVLELNAPKEQQSPTQEYVISQLQHNGLQVCMGIDAETGQPFTMGLIDGTHYKLIGASGMGKSCMAASILDQVTRTNDEAHVQIALLDLEHKTSRLFEHVPHVAELQAGRKRVECVATTADEVGEHLGYLHQELDRRKMLSEYDLVRERFMLIYVEEFLSLKYEIDPRLVEKMFADFSILALRGRKYRLYLLACSQVDYAAKNDAMKEANNQFNVNGAFSVRPSAARAAGFYDNRLLKTNFEGRKPGKFVLQTIGYSGIMLAPTFDVKAKLMQLDGGLSGFNQGSDRVQDGFRSHERGTLNVQSNPIKRAMNASSDILNPEPNADKDTVNEIMRLNDMNWTKEEVVCKLWNCTKGGSKAWKDGSAIYDAVIGALHTQG